MPSAGGPQALNRYAYTLNNPLRYTDPTGHFCVPCMVLGFIGGGIGGAAYGYGSQALNNWNAQPDKAKDAFRALTTNIDPDFIKFTTVVGAGGGAFVGSIVGPVVLAGVEVVQTAATTIGTALGGQQAWQRIASTDVAQATLNATGDLTKIASQLQSKATLLNIKVSGDMSNLNNPQVQRALNRINDISANADRVWQGTWKFRPVFEYIKDGIGVIRDQVTGELITIMDRSTPDKLQYLEDFVQNGTAQWLK